MKAFEGKPEKGSAFEEWWDFTGLSEHVNYHPDPEGPECYLVPGINRKEERREGFQAALEFVLSMERENYDLKQNIIPSWAVKIIKEELKEE